MSKLLATFYALVCSNDRVACVCRRLVSGKGVSAKFAGFHVFFEHFDWDAIETQQFSALYIPFKRRPEFMVTAADRTVSSRGRDVSGGSQMSLSGSSSAHKSGEVVVDESPVYSGNQAEFAAF